MIQIAQEDFNIEKYIDILSKGDPFGCRIKSLYVTYSANLPFVDYWIQIIDNRCVSLIARLESTFILRLSDYSDLEEISSFLRVAGASSIICNAKYKLIVDMNKKTGPILVCNTLFEYSDEYKVAQPGIREVHNLICQCESDNFNVPSYENFALDVAHKLKSNTIRLYAVKDENLGIKSCVMTLAESDDCAVLGALATAPDSRNCGLGSFLIKYISNKLLNEGKLVFLHRAPTENIEFYNKIGFKFYSNWSEYTLKD